MINSDYLIDALKNFTSMSDEIMNSHFLMPIKFKNKIYKRKDGLYTGNDNEYSFILTAYDDNEYYTVYTSENKIVNKNYDELIVISFTDLYKIFCDAPLYIKGIYINPDNDSCLLSKEFCVEVGFYRYSHKTYDEIYVLPYGLDEVLKTFQKEHKDLRELKIESIQYYDESGLRFTVEGLKVNKLKKELEVLLKPYFTNRLLEIEG